MDRVALQCGGCGQQLSTAQCNIPDRPQGVRCSRCKVVYYCDKHCQRRAWNAHKHICVDANQVSSNVHDAHRQNTPIVVARVFEEYLRHELREGVSMCLVITDISNAADHIRVMIPQGVRDGMWPELSHALRAQFELNCATHASSTAQSGNVHIVYMDASVKHFSTTINPVRPGPSSPRDAVPSPLSSLPSSSSPTILHMLSGPQFVESVIQHEIDRMLAEGERMGYGNNLAVQYLSDINHNAESIFGDRENAAERARTYARKKLREIVGEIRPSDTDANNT